MRKSCNACFMLVANVSAAILLSTLCLSSFADAQTNPCTTGTWASTAYTPTTAEDLTTKVYGGMVAGNVAGTYGGSGTTELNISVENGYSSSYSGTSETPIAVSVNATNARLFGAVFRDETIYLKGTTDTPITFQYNNLSNNKVSGANACGLAGLVYAGKSLQIDNAVFSNNTATANSTYIMGSVVSSYINRNSYLNNVTVSNNTASGSQVGGIVSAMSGEDKLSEGRYFSVMGTTAFTGNSSTGTLLTTVKDGQNMRAIEGGAFHCEPILFLGGKSGQANAGGATITFSNNTGTATATEAGVSGGAVFANRSTYVETDDNTITFTGNTATGNTEAYGGGLYAGRCSVSTATSYEIKLAGSNNTLMFDSNKAVANSGKAYGGAIAALKTTSSATSTTIPVNISLEASNTYTFTNNSVLGTTEALGGAIYAGNDLSIAGKSSFTGNTVTATGTAATTYAQGGAIYAIGNLTIAGTSSDKIVFSGNAVSGGRTSNYIGGSWGGAIYVENKNIGSATEKVTVNIDNATFTDNTTTKYAGAVGTYGVNGVTISNSAFSGNTSGYQGGAVQLWQTNGDISISNTSFTNNSTGKQGAGGALMIGAYRPGTYPEHAVPITISLSDVTFNNNEGSRGAGVYINNGTTNVDGKYTTLNLSGTNVFDGNKSTATFEDDKFGAGGGAIMANSNGTMTGSNTFTNNKAQESSGGAFSVTGAWTIGGNTLFENNTALNSGGAVFHATSSDADASSGAVSFTGSTAFKNNTATNGSGGAIADKTGLALSFQGTSEFTGNTAKVNGGAIYAAGNVTFSGDNSTATFSGNTANGVANDIYTTADVLISDKGTYNFGGGITANALSINEADVNFNAGSITAITGALTLNNATVGLNLTGSSTFSVGSLTATGKNTLNLYSTLTATGTQETAITSTGTVSLSNIDTNVYLAGSGTDGLIATASVSESGNNVIITATDVGEGFYSNGETATSLGEAITVPQGTDSTVSADIVVTKDNMSAGSSTVNLGTTNNVAIKANSAEQKVITSPTDASAVFTAADNSTTTLSLSNVQITGKTIDSNGVVYLTGTNASLIHSEGLGDVIIKASEVKFDNFDVTLGSTIEAATTNITNDSNVTIGASDTSATTVTTTGNLSVSKSTIKFDILGESSYDKLVVGGDVDFIDTLLQFTTHDYQISEGDTFDILSATGAITGLDQLSGSGAWAYNWVFSVSTKDGKNVLSATAAVPEPATWLLLICGLTRIYFIARKKKNFLFR